MSVNVKYSTLASAVPVLDDCKGADAEGLSSPVFKAVKPMAPAL